MRLQYFHGELRMEISMTQNATISNTADQSGIRLRSVLILEICIAAACLLIFRRFILRDDLLVYNGAGSDTRQQYIMWYTSIVNHLRSGSMSFWDFSNGFGGSMFNYYLFQPLLALVYAFCTLLGPARIPGMMVWLVVAEILLSGLFCYFMLSEWDFSEEAKMLSAFLYAFNGYFVIWGQHYGLGFVCLELPLLIWVIERSVRRLRNCFFVALVCMLVILSGYYQGYMVMLGMAVYVTVRVLLYEAAPWKKKLLIYLAVGMAMGFGVLLGAVNLLPSFGSLAVTSRLDPGGTFMERLLRNLTPYSGNYYRTLLFRIFGNNLQGTGRYFIGDGNYYEAAAVSMGSAAVILFCQFLPLFYRGRRRFARKAAVTAGILLAVFLLTVKAGSWVFNGFMYAFSRHTFLLMPFTAIMAAWTLSCLLRERRPCIPALLVSGVLCICVYVMAWKGYDHPLYRRNALFLLAAAAAETAVLFGTGSRKIRERYLAAALGACVFLSVYADVFLCYNYRESVSKSDPVYFGTYDGDTMKALERIRSEDNQFFRVEKDYAEASSYLDSAAQRYSSATTYNSQQNSYIQRFTANLAPGLLPGFDTNHYDFRNMFHDQPAASLMGIKYLLTHSNDLKVRGYEPAGQEGEVFIYRNTGTENIARFYTKTISEKTFRKLKETIPVWNLMGDVLITEGKTEFSVKAKNLSDRVKQDSTQEAAPAYAAAGAGMLKGNVSADPSDPETLFTDASGAVIIPLEEEFVSGTETVIADFVLSPGSAAEFTVFTNDGRPVSWYGGRDKHFQILLPAETRSLTIKAAVSEDPFYVKDLHFYTSSYPKDSFCEADITVDALQRDDTVTGRADLPEDGILMLAIPYQEGWTAQVDGERAALMRVDFGFTGISMGKGEHVFSLAYRAPLLREGMLVSLAAAVIWLLLFLGTMYLEKKKNKRERG